MLILIVLSVPALVVISRLLAEVRAGQSHHWPTPNACRMQPLPVVVPLGDRLAHRLPRC